MKLLINNLHRKGPEIVQREYWFIILNRKLYTIYVWIGVYTDKHVI